MTAISTPCAGELTGSTLNYVRFELPDASEGTLYYNYRNGSYDSKVSESRNYYRSSSPYLDRITFVPKKDFPPARWTSRLPAGVPRERSSMARWSLVWTAATPPYAIRQNTESLPHSRTGNLTNLSEMLTGEHVNMCVFQLLDSDDGTLYYDYDDGKYASKVSSSRNYYRSSSAYLERVSFVPDENFYGTVKIGFTGWNTKGGAL